MQPVGLTAAVHKPAPAGGGGGSGSRSTTIASGEGAGGLSRTSGNSSSAHFGQPASNVGAFRVAITPNQRLERRFRGMLRTAPPASPPSAAHQVSPALIDNRIPPSVPGAGGATQGVVFGIAVPGAREELLPAQRQRLSRHHARHGAQH